MSTITYHCRLCKITAPSTLPSLSTPCQRCFPDGCWLLKPCSPKVTTLPNTTVLVCTFEYSCTRCEQVRPMRSWSRVIRKYTVEKLIPGDWAWKPMKGDPNPPTHTCKLCFPWENGMWAKENTKSVRFEDLSLGPGESEDDPDPPPSQA
ncbi:hypothetical protein VTL71DRAFT_2176 [Oculimacula yallundae]|uniref:Uncharacterized protein n=1 Tax=Oculimacula yallundae TaxID=86028 RepID=A0ABR4C857_9HELO